jgi:NAD(P)-dependent dehydrogenase (short-subunit alcohol dehydrogenase family)
MSTFLDGLFELSGRRAVVTAGSSGIGPQIAVASGRAGAAITVVARHPGGRVINISSQPAIRAFGNSGAYGGSKAAVSGLTRYFSSSASAYVTGQTIFVDGGFSVT